MQVANTLFKTLPRCLPGDVINNSLRSFKMEKQKTSWRPYICNTYAKLDTNTYGKLDTYYDFSIDKRIALG